MKLAPKTFIGRTLAVTAAALILGQILTMALFGLFVLRPQTERVAGMFAQSIAATSSIMDSASPAQRTRIMKKLDETEYLDVWPGEAPPPAGGGRPRILERIFMQSLVDAMVDQTDMSWRTDQDRKLWIRVKLGPDHYWISARAPESREPLRAVLFSGAAALILAMATAVGIQRRLSRPLESLEQAVADFRVDRPGPALPESGPREIAGLSRSFNAMTARLASAETDRNLMLAGVSHDVRTPLARLRLAVEMLASNDPALGEKAHAQVEEIDRILSQFMTFARGFDGEAARPVDIDQLVATLVAARQTEGGDLAVELGDPIGVMTIREDGVRRALANLLDNALRHGAAPVRVKAMRSGAMIRIAVRDSGAGAPPGRLASLSEPFARGDAARGSGGGTGLGLAIADRVARLHEGELKLANLPDGGFEAALLLRGAATSTA